MNAELLFTYLDSIETALWSLVILACLRFAVALFIASQGHKRRF